MTTKYKANRLDSNNVLYRGKLITMNPEIAQYKTGRYSVQGYLCKFGTLKEAKNTIDQLCLKASVDSF